MFLRVGKKLETLEEMPYNGGDAKLLIDSSLNSGSTQDTGGTVPS